MAYHFNDNVYTKSFTPREPQVELLDAATQKNIIACLCTNTGKSFLSNKIIEHFTSQIFTKKQSKIVYLADSETVVEQRGACFKRLTNLAVTIVTDVEMFSSAAEWKTHVMNHQVLVLTTEVGVYLLEHKFLVMEDVCLLVLYGCHSILDNGHPLRQVMQYYEASVSKPHVLGLATSLFSCGLEPGQIEAKLSQVEQLLHSQAETCSDVVTVLRYGTHPKEFILESGTHRASDIDSIIEQELDKVEQFLEVHRYDPNEIYEGFSEELQDVPDPRAEPMAVLKQMRVTLRTLGASCADRAAYVSLVYIERLKVATPYERHFLLLCLVSSTLVKIRAILDDHLRHLSEKERIYRFCSPKVLRMLEVVKKFKPKKDVGEDEEDDEDVISNNGDCNVTKAQCDCNIIYSFLLERLVNPSVSLQEFKKAVNKSVIQDELVHYQETFYLPKFKVPRYTRYERLKSYQLAQSRGDDAQARYRYKTPADVDPHALCGLILVEDKFTAKVLFQLLSDLRQVDEDLSFLSVHFTTGKVVETGKNQKEVESEHRKQELVLKRFRMRECNLLIGTRFLEEGIDLPKCNLVLRFDLPRDYRSYVQSKERARAADSIFCLLVDSNEMNDFVEELAKYYEIEQMLLRKCSNKEPSEAEELEADLYTGLVHTFCPMLKVGCPYVDLSCAIALVNKYCAKLPSDTFTRLTPLWTVTQLHVRGRTMYVCSIRLPINSPVKQQIVGYPMPTQVLARRFAALQCCQLLHASHELDDTLQPITKESFWMKEEEQLSMTPEELKDMTPRDIVDPRPGTTKRQQYYYKRIAESLTDCRPVAGNLSYLYNISMTLTCPLPEEQNTRGRKIYAPEDSTQGFGILTSKTIPKIGAFPIFTRSGEVQVKLELASEAVTLTDDQVSKVIAFIHYTFTSVLRLQRYLMMFDPDSSENSYFIVPTKQDETGVVSLNWEFLELIYEQRSAVPSLVPEEDRRGFKFDRAQYEDAVVSPWYRNQDEPQYFYVAEICTQLTPKAAFPGTEYSTFEEYYLKKYSIQIQDCSQALLDVDHTSARLNFLTPRYVNRKGVALPTTSEEKKRAKRENLEQKQILVPELCSIHPFPSSLWRKAVCLPCILHRVNALLLADQVRRVVAKGIGLGAKELDRHYNWKPLNFGWSLADVLNRAKPEEGPLAVVSSQLELSALCSEEGKEEEERKETQSWMEIGTWSNDMAVSRANQAMLTFDSSPTQRVDPWSNNDVVARYGSPTSWMDGSRACEDEVSDVLSDCSYSDDDLRDFSDSSSESGSTTGKLRIEYKENNVAEAFDDDKTAAMTMKAKFDLEEVEELPWEYKENLNMKEVVETCIERFQQAVVSNKHTIRTCGMLYDRDKSFDWDRANAFNNGTKQPAADSETPHDSFGNSNNQTPQLVEVLPQSLADLPLTPLLVEAVREKQRKQEHVLVNGWAKDREGEKQRGGAMTNGWGRSHEEHFSFDEQPELKDHPGPSPSLILQALTMSNANDGINLERLETIGDSFLKYAITTYLYCTYDNVHEGKLSHLRSKQVSNLNLYRLGRRKVLGESMVATKFEPHDNWLPPCYYVPRELERALIEAGVPACHWNRADLPALHSLSSEEIARLVRERGEKLGIHCETAGSAGTVEMVPSLNLESMPCFIPYNLMTQHSISDKSVADCVEALIGAYLVACGPRGALLFMSWLGIKVLPRTEHTATCKQHLKEGVGASIPEHTADKQTWTQVCFGELKLPKAPLLHHVADPESELDWLLRGFEAFEESIQYRFQDRSYLLQALTHASYTPNRVTDCYQRLEFLGDAVLDYLITRHLYEDPRHHSPGALTDLRSALVNNTIFASFAVRHNFHQFFRHLCPGLSEVVDRFVRIQQENGHSISEECYLIEEGECEEAEDVEVPKALGDVFESVAGAIFLDSGMSLDAVWCVYHRIMKNEIELFSTHVPKSPIRELFELEPETAQFGKPEKLADGRRVRVTVEVFGKGQFNGIGRNYRIAKCTAAKCALRQLKRRGLLDKRK